MKNNILTFLIIGAVIIGAIMIIPKINNQSVYNDAYRSCYDNDGGINYNVKGKVTVGWPDNTQSTAEDYCNGDTETKLIENYCQGTTWQTASYSCPTGCASGACISTISTTTLPPPTPTTTTTTTQPWGDCTDSDNGDNPWVKGTTTATEGSYTDLCVSDTLNEYICISGKIWNVGKICGQYQSGSHCLNGACTNPPSSTIPLPSFNCADSDGGMNYEVKGTITYGSASMSDSCFDIQHIREYYCVNNAPASQDVMCSTYLCLNGACVHDNSNPTTTIPSVNSNTCYDSDGNNIFTAGTTSVPGGSSWIVDGCTSDKTGVVEGICSSLAAPIGVTEPCPAGYTCSNGACKTTPTGTSCSIKGDVMSCNSICDDEYSVIVANWKSQQVSDPQYATAVNYWKISNNVC